ncbi:hypothetical protein NDU88_001849 [Pleurodeles waltl]|uniref:Uncharacterized protein n=1 Tax=Pleurodeles waltl TaxID=8319 RepID=A0AAV7Q879_PLEWA|nr:hypothetical protein NDU88_001849 [Pleurodeles waltl]
MMPRLGRCFLIPTMGKPKKREEHYQDGTSATRQLGQSQSAGPQEGRDPQVTTLDTVLLAIKESRKAIERKIDNLTIDLSLLRDDHRKLAERVGTNEKTITLVTTMQKTTSSELMDLTSRVKTLETRA